MSDEQKNPGHRWQEGHPRFGGRKKRTAAQARSLADEMGVDPLEFMLALLKSDVIEQTVIDEKGREKRVRVTVPLDVRLDAAKTVINYMYPRLSAQAVQAQIDTTVSVDVDITKLLKDPDAVEAAQSLALKLAAMESEQYRAEHGLSEPRLLP